MEARAHGVWSQFAGDGDLGIVEARRFTHQEHLAVERREPLERLPHGSGGLLARRRSRVAGNDDVGASAAFVANAIEGEVPRDAEDPGAAPRLVCFGHRPAGHPDKHFLCQLVGLPVADEPTEIPENAIPVRTEQDVCVAHLSLKTPDEANPLTDWLG